MAEPELGGDHMRVSVDAEGTATIYFNDVGTGRNCGNRTLCCRLIPVPTINKEANQRCQHQRRTGCAIYAQRPFACKTWGCVWLVSDDAGNLPRPDHCHYVVDITPDYITAQGQDGEKHRFNAIQVWVDPSYPDAHRDPRLRAYLNEQNEKFGALAVIRYNSRRAFILVPPSMNGGEWLEHHDGIAVPEKSEDR